MLDNFYKLKLSLLIFFRLTVSITRLFQHCFSYFCGFYGFV